MSDLPANDQIKIGSKVAIEKKEDQGTGKLTEGIVKAKLTSSKTHPHGIKVELEDGSVGRVKKILSDSSEKLTSTPLTSEDSTKIDTIIPKDEDTWNEFKSTFQYDLDEENLRNRGKIESANARRDNRKKYRAEIQKEISITISAFANQEGGRLFIGVNDDSSILGLDRDLKEFDGSMDKFKLAIIDSLKHFLKNNAFIAKLKFEFATNNEKQYLLIQVPKSTEPIYIHFSNIQETFVRIQNRSQKFNTQEFLKHCKDRF